MCTPPYVHWTAQVFFWCKQIMLLFSRGYRWSPPVRSVTKLRWTFSWPPSKSTNIRPLPGKRWAISPSRATWISLRFNNWSVLSPSHRPDVTTTMTRSSASRSHRLLGWPGPGSAWRTMNTTLLSNNPPRWASFRGPGLKWRTFLASLTCSWVSIKPNTWPMRNANNPFEIIILKQTAHHTKSCLFIVSSLVFYSSWLHVRTLRRINRILHNYKSIVLTI